jgi:RNA polymerase sigma factor (sigma-70 family)
MHDLSTGDVVARREQARLLQEKDNSFWDTVIQEVRKIVYALRNYYNLERAEMTSATLEHLWEKRDAYKPEEGSLRQWIVAMAQNLAKDMLKSKRHKSRLLQAQYGYEGLCLARREEPPAPCAKARDLDEILAALPPYDREIILEHSRTDGAGQWAVELGERLGIRAGTIRVKRLRIKERIKRAFQDRGYVPAGPRQELPNAAGIDNGKP